MNVKRAFWVGSALVYWVVCSGAQAQIYKCVDSDGHVVFTDSECGSTKEKVDIVQSSGGLSSAPATGLSTQEKAALGEIEAREAENAALRAGNSALDGASSSRAAVAPAPSTAPRSGY